MSTAQEILWHTKAVEKFRAGGTYVEVITVLLLEKCPTTKAINIAKQALKQVQEERVAGNFKDNPFQRY